MSNRGLHSIEKRDVSEKPFTADSSSITVSEESVVVTKYVQEYSDLVVVANDMLERDCALAEISPDFVYTKLQPTKFTQTSHIAQLSKNSLIPTTQCLILPTSVACQFIKRTFNRN